MHAYVKYNFRNICTKLISRSYKISETYLNYDYNCVRTKNLKDPFKKSLLDKMYDVYSDVVRP